MPPFYHNPEPQRVLAHGCGIFTGGTSVANPDVDSVSGLQEKCEDGPRKIATAYVAFHADGISDPMRREGLFDLFAWRHSSAGRWCLRTSSLVDAADQAFEIRGFRQGEDLWVVGGGGAGFQ